MSVKNCFSKSKNKKLKSIFKEKLKDYSAEEAAVQAIKEFSNSLSRDIGFFIGAQHKVITSDISTVSEEIDEISTIEQQKVRIVDATERTETIAGKRNKVFNLFKDVLSDPKYYEEMMTPIDNDTFRVGSLSMMKDSPTQPYDVYDPIEAILKKFAYKLGGEGVGVAANNHSDHVLTQGKSLKAYFQQGTWGNRQFDEQTSAILSDTDHSALVQHINAYKLEKKEDLLTEEESSALSSIKISSTLSELINAFVDIANDKAMVARANWGTLFNNYGMGLIRAGVHPHKVSALLAQPVLRELAKEISLKEGIIDNESSKDIETALLEKLGFTETGFKNVVSLNQLDFINMLNTSKEDLKDVDPGLQIQVLLHYIQTKPSIKKYVNFVLAAKVDAKGAGTNLTDTIVEINRMSEGFEFDGKTGIEGVWEKYFDSIGEPTLTYTQYMNTVEFLMDFMHANPTFFNGMNRGTIQRFQEIATASRDNGRLLQRKPIDFITRTFDDYKMSFFGPLSVNNSTLSEGELDDRIKDLKGEGEYLILNKLLQDVDDTYLIDRVARTSAETKNSLTDSWRVLLEKEPAIGNYLVRESYKKKGFAPGPKQFHQLIPFEWFSTNEYEEHMLNNPLLDEAFVEFAMEQDNELDFFKNISKGQFKEVNSVDVAVVPLDKDLGLGKTGKNGIFIPPYYTKINGVSAKLSKIATFKIEKNKIQVAVYGKIGDSAIEDSFIKDNIYNEVGPVHFSDGITLLRDTPKIINLAFEREMRQVAQNVSNSEDTGTINDLNCI